MTTAPLLRKIRKRGFLGDLRESEPLSRHLYLKTGGPAALFAIPESTEDILELMEFLKLEGIPWVLLGGGTNVVFANGGYPGCVVRLGRRFARMKVEADSILLTGAAATLTGAMETSAAHGLAGMECLAGIPGTVGGAVTMNAGTREGEISDVIREVRVFDGEDIHWLPAEKLGFSYRSSSLPETHVILEARLGLALSTEEEVRSRIHVLKQKRTETQPSGLPSAGCWFKNPAGDSAGRLIDEAGMKGIRVGNAQVSEVHANFFVNLGGATTSDFLTLAEKVRGTVHKRFGVMLQEEVRVIHE
ncbi:MAG: UDP-N-acetylmuramate dehydrogenase [bacterium]|nr:UDP-N-acetylmuramate dehydrogenase [bacterium]MDT8365040.1 UDP-N-acetylmuramate dehydrogenase [bacterium]